MRALVLILASDGPYYDKLQNIWRQYMHSISDTFDAYFYKADPTLDCDFKIIDDIVYCRCPDRMEFLVDKLKLAIRAFGERLFEYDIIIRPNLSTFVIYKNLIDIFNQYNILLQQTFHSATQIDLENTALSGALFFASPNIFYHFSKSAIQQLPPLENGYDDVTFSHFIQTTFPTSTHIILNRYDILKLEDIRGITADMFDELYFHIRVKCVFNRSVQDITIYQHLLSEFYDINYEID